MAIPIVPIAIGGAILAGAILPKKSFDRLLLLGGIGVGGYLLLQRIPKAEDIPDMAEGFGYGLTGGLGGLLEGMFKGMERLIPDIDLAGIVPDLPDVTFPDLPDVKIDLPEVTFPDLPDVTEGVGHIVEGAKDWIDEGEKIIQAVPSWQMPFFTPAGVAVAGKLGLMPAAVIGSGQVVQGVADLWEFLPIDEVIDVGEDVWEWKIDRAQEAWDWVF